MKQPSMRLERQARILALQALCQWEVQPRGLPPVPAEIAAMTDAPGEAVPLAESLLRSYFSRRRDVDDLVAAALEHWDLSRLTAVDRNILRVAVTELRTNAAPPKVAINEAVEIGREYGGADSPRFLNGVLDRVFKSLPEGDR